MYYFNEWQLSAVEFVLDVIFTPLWHLLTKLLFSGYLTFLTEGSDDHIASSIHTEWCSKLGHVIKGRIGCLGCFWIEPGWKDKVADADLISVHRDSVSPVFNRVT